MKKYLFGTFAILIALGLSAFHLPAEKKTTTTSTLQFWHYNPNNPNELGSYVGVFDPVTEQAELEAATCTDDGNIECARGYAMSFDENNKPEGDEIQDYLDIQAHD